MPITADAPVDYYSNVRSDIGPLLPAHAARVLEIGCGTGATLAWLKAAGRCDATTGFELSEEAATSARRAADRVLVGDAERLVDSELGAGSFDLILCLDVLEHLVDPWRFVEKLERLLSAGGTLIASVPNVRHVRAWAPLVLRGRWNYKPSGILDRGHLRFFTRAGALALMSSGSLRVCADRSNLAARGRWIDFATLGLLREFLAIQYVIASRKTG
jgi:SAM-dependent methyltransferase